jgi:hypothetical protein
MVRGRSRRRWWLHAIAGGAIVLLALIAGCSEEPTEANSPVADLPLAGFITQDTTLPALHGTFFRQYTTMDGLINLVGTNGSYTAIAALQFAPSYFPIRDTIAVFSATLTLHAVSRYGNPGAPLGFTVYRINRSWSSYTLTWDTVQTDFYESLPRGSFDGTLPSDTAVITVPLDTAMVREWFATPTTTTTTQFGIVLVPSASTRNAICGFAEFALGDSTSYYPTLTVIAGNVGGTSLDTSAYSSGQDSFVGNDDHGTAPSTKLYVQGGVVYRSALWFDLSSIPRGAILNSAVLSLDLDYASSHISELVTDTSIAAHLLGDSTTYTSFTTENSSMFGRRVAGSPSTFEFNIRPAAQSWVRGPNYGILIRVPSSREFTTPDLYVFDSNTASTPSLRPRLRIVYSTKSN